VVFLSGGESVHVFHRRVEISSTSLTPSYFVHVTNPGPGSPMPYVDVYFVVSGLR